MKECSKSIARRLGDANFTNHYFVGHGLDIGGKPDPLGLYTEMFCRMQSVRTWDWEDGDAQFLAGVADDSIDFVHSSHCLEHLQDPVEGLKNWFRVVRPGGHLVITVPDEDLYEQGVFPSQFNLDHKWTFSVNKRKSWSNRSVNVVDLIGSLDERADLTKLELLISTYRFALPRYDQSQTPVGECGIEFVVRKRLAQEIDDRGRFPRETQPAKELRVHLNQYRDDRLSMKRNNEGAPPFTNEDPI